MITAQDVAEVYRQVWNHPDKYLIKGLLLKSISAQDRAIYEFLQSSISALTSNVIAGHIGILRQNASRSLKKLCDYGLVKRKEEQNTYVYWVT